MVANTTALPFSKAEYEALARFRYGLRLYLAFSERVAHQVGITPQQYSLLIALKGFPGRNWATTTELAERLQITPSSTVGLIDRLTANGLVERHTHHHDRRSHAIYLTDQADALLARLSANHRNELGRMAEMLRLPPEINSGHSDSHQL